MVRILFLVLLSSFWIISGAEAHYIINLEISKEPRIVRLKTPKESPLLDETLNVRIVSQIPIIANEDILLCYVGKERPSYYFDSFLVESKTERNTYILEHNLLVQKGMKGIWYCTLLFDRDLILFELHVYVTSPNEVSSKAEIATEIGFNRNIVAPIKINPNKRHSAKTILDTYGNGAKPHSNYKTENDDNDTIGEEPQIDGTTINTNKHIYGYGAAPQNTFYRRYMKRYKLKPGSYGYDAEPEVNETTSNTNKRYYDYGAAAAPQNTRFNGTTSTPKNDGHARKHLDQPGNVKKDNDVSVADIKMYIFIAIATGGGILLGTIVGVLCRKKFKTPDSEPIVSFTTADPVYDDVYSAKLDIVNRPPQPLPFEEREENKEYIHYDTPYDHRCGWRPPQQVTFMK